ncbi:hypothetical protein GJAV_G00202370 [Gymnothorax javanicus]|nr:hypothetical protein GJAV_G00202370 [Gymnothorax javanicus]
MDLDSDVEHNTCAWTKTRQAVAEFRSLLLCAKCSKLMSEPVCFGTCEHMFCRTCAGTQVGHGCSVCHSPSWVRDIQVNRQLNSITQLFRELDSLLNPKELAATPPACSSPESAEPAVYKVKPKRSVKIWFSPRSRKVRCQVEGSSEGARKPPEEPSQDFSVYNFNSSSQDSSSSPQRSRGNGSLRKKAATKATRKRPQNCSRPATRRQTKTASKKDKLASINKEWGFNQDGGVSGKEGQDEEGENQSRDRPCRKVSFQITQAPPGVLEDPMQPGPQCDDPPHTPNGHVLEGEASSEDRPASEEAVTFQNEIASPTRVQKPSAKTTDPAVPSAKPAPSTLARRSSKRALPAEGAQLECTPKRLRPSPGRRRGSRARQDGSPAPSSTQASPDPGTPVRRSPKDQGNLLGSPQTPNRGSPGGSAFLRGRLSQGSPAYLRRNQKGETPLHLAAIKGDVEAVKELLDQGADPNLKDHAGWTPLHEACNLGHLGVVEALLQQGALLNTPGYENDSPLHDAVRNGHMNVARLLVERGASREVLNMFGLRPVDYAATEEMLAILRPPSEGPHPASTPVSPTASLSKVAGGGRREGLVMFLGSKLSVHQRNDLSKLSRLLGVQCMDSFCSAVTHILVPEGPMPTTLSCFRGVLNGCWVLRFSWVVECLKVKDWVEETEFVAGEGPLRSRINRDNLLPQLFDGCFFFFLGSFQNPSKEELMQLAKEGGGQVLTRQPKPDSDVTQTLAAAAYHAQPAQTKPSARSTSSPSRAGAIAEYVAYQRFHLVRRVPENAYTRGLEVFG